MILVALFGPFIHQGPQHLVDNLGVLLVAGAYLEYEYERRDLYVFYLGVGYISAWAPILMGFTGSVGASGVTYGLSAWLFLHSISRILEMAKDGTFDVRAIHFISFAFGSGQIAKAAEIIGSTVGAGDITHFFGAILGMFLGLHFEVDYYGILHKN